jgi:hypothetical protein
MRPFDEGSGQVILRLKKPDAGYPETSQTPRDSDGLIQPSVDCGENEIIIGMISNSR